MVVLTWHTPPFFLLERVCVSVILSDDGLMILSYMYKHSKRKERTLLKQNYSQICTFFAFCCYFKKQTSIYSEFRTREFACLKKMIIFRTLKYEENLINGWLTISLFSYFFSKYIYTTKLFFSPLY